ncbi:cell growth-regulating nucleolar protein [Macrotis lagotis]|uniref:cell growth-regulating nucleolar protein n=1 Tax=Macrotis lagotis TaxID=92651 RepID=UPI003D68E540
MVFFTCNACGESVKKGQVEKHVNICKNCQYLSCIDCGKDFWGEEYKKHVKCIIEDQKYGGKGYEVKPNKGDVKQQEWIQKIHEIMKKPSISPKLQEILEKVSGFDNIPRKKAKFQNWMKNSLKIYSDSLQEQVWDIFSEATSNGPNTKEEKQPHNQVENQHSENKIKTATTEVSEKTVGKSEGKKSKRERKEERQKNRKKEKKELKLENHQKNSSDQKSQKHKRSQVEESDAKTEEKPEISNTEKKKDKKKKKKDCAAGSEVHGNGNHVEMMTEEETKASAEKRKRKHSEVLEEADSKKKKMKHTENTNLETLESETPIKGKFNWKGTIKAILKQAPDNEIAVKKLRKKVLAQYYAVTNEHHRSEEELLVIFNKKINKNPSFKLLKEKVKLLK